MTSPPSRPPGHDDNASAGSQTREWMSALADGRADALPQATQSWRDDADARASWHLYHLIGDVMRSDDLASSPARDAEFLATLRTRLAAEPVPLAPANTAAPARAPKRRLGWRAPAAMAAGFFAVAATLVLMRPEALTGAAGSQLAGAEGAGAAASMAGGGVRAVPNPLPSAGGPLVAEGGMIRDARLDAYLRAHQEARGIAPAALPGGGLRNAEIVIVPVPAARPAVSAGSGPR